jgi:hypothetical protein
MKVITTIENNEKIQWYENSFEKKLIIATIIAFSVMLVDFLLLFGLFYPLRGSFIPCVLLCVLIVELVIGIIVIARLLLTDVLAYTGISQSGIYLKYGFTRNFRYGQNKNIERILWKDIKGIVPIITIGRLHLKKKPQGYGLVLNDKVLAIPLFYSDYIKLKDTLLEAYAQNKKNMIAGQ